MSRQEIQLRHEAFIMISRAYRAGLEIAQSHGEGSEAAHSAGMWMGFHAWEHMRKSAYWHAAFNRVWEMWGGEG